MKNLIRYFLLLLLCCLTSCKDQIKTSQPSSIEKVKQAAFLPFQSITLDNITSFKSTSKNWGIVGSVFADRSKDNVMTAADGSGVLFNDYSKDQKDHLFTNFEHADIEVELDVMMPKGSNSGIYFQSRYEVQLFDSWGKSEIDNTDMGGVYQRWDDSQEEGNEGFEGSAPLTNASKSPGLWQHFKIIFHAPKFDTEGKKIKNASFEEVWLNGVLVQKNVDVSGPTRAAPFEDELPKASLMLQGDHGPVAFKNIKYKNYSGDKVLVSDITMSVFEHKEVVLKKLDTMLPIQHIKVDSLSSNMITDALPQKVLKFEGMLDIPKTGDYLFDLKLFEQGGIVLVDKDTIFYKNGVYHLDSLNLSKVNLTKGKVPFTFIYNKHRSWTNGFSLDVEGPGVQKQSLSALNSLDLSVLQPKENIMVFVFEEPIAQRSFLIHEGTKKTHCISVGNPQGIHYSYDLELGSLLQVWDGGFFDASEMWYGRGEKQLGAAAGFIISLHGDSELAQLTDADATWPNAQISNDYRQLGYEFGVDGYPIFSYQIAGSMVTNTLIPLANSRGLHRKITIGKSKDLWLKLADGESIEKLADGSFLINNESYFIDFTDKENLKPIIRQNGGRDELIVKIGLEEQQIDYSIIW